MQLARFYSRREGNGSSAGLWLVPDLGLVLSCHRGRWQLRPTRLLHTHEVHGGNPRLWHQQRREWLIRHGLDQAEFQRRRDAVAAVEYALQRDPLPPGVPV